MQKISPVKVVAGIAAIVMAIAGLLFATQLRGAVSDMFTVIRLNSPKASPQPAQVNGAGTGAAASGVRVIPFGVTAPASAPHAGKASGG